MGQKEITDDFVIGEVSLAYEVFRVDVDLDFKYNKVSDDQMSRFKKTIGLYSSYSYLFG